ncbi:hypothetical protein ACUN0C_19425 [Faunimonas sp. B44]|uniref:hypothetical protein n=1 Tax=Faunimonas sp. B44 TaxID=3461493 RepID=UPI0040448B9B
MRTWTKARWAVALAASAGVLAFAAANAHLVYVAVKSQPDCVSHLKQAGERPGQFRAARSAC